MYDNKGNPIFVIADPSTRNGIGIQNGGLKVANVYEPARDVFITWLFGSDGATSALTAAAEGLSVFADQSLINVNQRQIVIVNGNAAPTYAYNIYFSRNGLGVATDDKYAAITSGSAARAQILQIPIPAANGYDEYLQLGITPAGGQAGTQLNFKAYLIGRGG